MLNPGLLPGSGQRKRLSEGNVGEGPTKAEQAEIWENTGRSASGVLELLWIVGDSFSTEPLGWHWC